MPRFLHTADWQIGRQYSQFPADDAGPLAEARLAAVETVARLAAEHKVDAVLVAGDVFDAQTVADRTIRSDMDDAFRAISRLASGTPHEESSEYLSIPSMNRSSASADEHPARRWQIDVTVQPD